MGKEILVSPPSAARGSTIPPAPLIRPYQIGKARWYGLPFHGKKTASGELYDMFSLTAAHRRLPLGSLVRVTNLANRRAVLVRINDRGPVRDSGSILDLSYEAGRQLGMARAGVARVRLDVVSN